MFSVSSKNILCKLNKYYFEEKKQGHHSLRTSQSVSQSFSKSKGTKTSQDSSESLAILGYKQLKYQDFQVNSRIRMSSAEISNQ